MNIIFRMTFMLSLAFLILISSSSVSAKSSSGVYKDKVAVLMYHHVHDKDSSSSTISSMLFRDQLIYLKSKGYQFIRLEDFRHFLAGGAVPSNAVLITFDDGYESFYKVAYPILKELSIPAVNFTITSYLEKPSKTIPHLSYAQMKQMMAKSTSIDFQCHTNQLHKKVGEKSALTYVNKKAGGKNALELHKSRVKQDTQTCVNLLKKAGVKNPDSISYPFGIYSKSLFPTMLGSGVVYGYTTKPGLAKKGINKLEIPRINAGSPDITPEVLYKRIKRLT
ncbi:polysaccharide deacetylase family protein [Paenibacillus sp. TAF43_2]|uniref:polysaccharide deacetylase family protein n=1 Tax=Paenibacillus sp. TAF43_2 TaxID=3233069 RepID=UPI003F94D5EE